MRIRSKFMFAAGAILAMTLGFPCLARAAPLAGFAAAVPAVQLTGESAASEALPEKAYYYRRYYYRRPYYHPHYYHRRYYHRRITECPSLNRMDHL